MEVLKMTESVSNISGSNYSSTGVLSGGTTAKEMKDEFLMLLTQQLKAQNPLNPYNNQEFATQLAQFSELEQLTDIRSLMEEQVQTNLMLTQTIADSALPGLLGKSAKAISDKSHYNGENDMPVGYNLPYQVSAAELTIFDQSGNIVNTISLSGFDLTSGDHKITWDGMNSEGDPMPAGEYFFKVTTTSDDGVRTDQDTFTYGKIESIRFKNEGTMLLIAGLEAPLGSITDISTNG
jgi:flagellar basal-body rod modification protein FlgD